MEKLLQVKKLSKSQILRRIASQCDRILYLLDGRICGDLTPDQAASQRQREDAVNRWLAEMGW